MDTNRIFSADQLVVPPELPAILKEWCKEVIRENPSDVLAFSADYFQARAVVANKGRLTDDEMNELRTLFDKYDMEGNGKMVVDDFTRFVENDLGFDCAEIDVKEVVATLDSNQSGYLEFDEIITWWSGVQ